MGITVDAVRSRIKRGTIAHVREGGRVYVLLGADQGTTSHDQPTDRPGEPNALISEMRGRIEDLREQLEAERQAHAEARRIIAGLVERIPPAIEASRETPGASETASAPAQRDTPFTDEERPQEPSERRSWWRRLWEG